MCKKMMALTSYEPDVNSGMLWCLCAIQCASSHCELLDRKSYEVIGRKACCCGTFWEVGRERALFSCQRLKLYFINLDACI